jgi:hypothetical protein
VKRRWYYLINIYSEVFGLKKETLKKKILGNRERSYSDSRLKSGDKVKVRSIDEIKDTLNHWNQLKGCSFMEEMKAYCGTTQRVLKRVEKFLDERDYLVKRCNGIVILDGVFCEGTKDFGSCDRTCFFFWREEWLEKIE